MVTLAPRWRPEPVETVHEDCFGISFHGEIAILAPSGAVEKLPWEFMESATEAILPPLLFRDPPMVVVDLSEIDYCGSVFLSLLLRIEKAIRRRHGTMALCGIGPKPRELLRITSLDTLWAIYESREEAVEALEAE